VLGTARCRRLQVEDGGQITGRIEMITDTLPRAVDQRADLPAG
jgi:cytoskeletal protein CcmA (bactofilin family)